MNGFIQAQHQAGGGFSETGEPIPAISSFGEKIECSYYANVLHNRGRYDDGKFTATEYIITLNDMSFNADYIRLINSRGDVVCKKAVQSLELLEDIQRVKIAI